MSTKAVRSCAVGGGEPLGYIDGAELKTRSNRKGQSRR